MKIEIANGYVELLDVYTRKADRLYNEALYRDATVDEKGKYTLNPQQLDKAPDAAMIALVKKAVVFETNINGEQTEKQIEINADWFDSLQDIDYKKISKAVLKMKLESDEQAKKL